MATQHEVRERMRRCMTRMSDMPVTLEHAHLLMGYPADGGTTLGETLCSESGRRVLFAMHALLCQELAEAHAQHAYDHVKAKIEGNGNAGKVGKAGKKST